MDRKLATGLYTRIATESPKLTGSQSSLAKILNPNIVDFHKNIRFDFF